MKAVVYHKYGSPEVLKLEEIPKPSPEDNEVLIKVHAASVNSWDWDLLRGRPYIVRLWGLFKPKYTTPGADVAGRVEAVGKNVKRFQPGDEVFGDLCQCGWGGFAEYVCVHENALAIKPASMTFEEAAAIPQAGVMALQSIQDKGQVQSGQKVLINGAGGGVGTFAIQMAKSLGAEVTGVDSAEKHAMMQSIGADHVIDYRREDFAKNGQQYDLIIDVVANRSVFDYKRALKPHGIFVMIGGAGNSIVQTMFLGPIISKFGKKEIGILAHEPNKHLDAIKALFEAEKVRSIIDRCYPIGEISEAMRYFGEGHVQGKVIITMEN
ncbi:NAD(P)-dependent alcohol dehydrogenase [Fulvivirgaceae bacterium BMA10]|uniref:NAD(P)-dependent alcohol dehydrogenase n=1 Tax=Splendidivirga corallicola TaxID=3051826 RepID=A0ABT8KPN2_9BACT|nr:NAD(P)-dependent alcohol dehydrogenase [Fulvivirgaceae bacterium BMA10]